MRTQLPPEEPFVIQFEALVVALGAAGLASVVLVTLRIGRGRRTGTNLGNDVGRRQRWLATGRASSAHEGADTVAMRRRLDELERDLSDARRQVVMLRSERAVHLAEMSWIETPPPQPTESSWADEAAATLDATEGPLDPFGPAPVGAVGRDRLDHPHSARSGLPQRRRGATVDLTT